MEVTGIKQIRKPKFLKQLYCQINQDPMKEEEKVGEGEKKLLNLEDLKWFLVP